MTTLGSFTLDGRRIDVERGWSVIDGYTYRFVQAKPRRVVATSSHRGLTITEGVNFEQVDLLAGLRGVLKGRP